MPPPPVLIDEPKHALASFRTALAAQREHRAPHPLRISWFGDSVTADDQITHGLRRRLQAELGDGGPGFVFAAPPHPYCQHRALARSASDEWTVHGISGLIPPDLLLGLGGSTETEDGGTIKLVPATPITSFDLHYLAQPGGGTLELVADGKSAGKLDTRASAKHGLFFAAQLVAAKKLELRARGRIRLFGAALENPQGAVVDNLGIVNATAKAMHHHQLPEHFHNQLAHRAPDLVVVMYGTNEAEWLAANGSGMAEHERLLGELLANIRSVASSVLVVSPLDQLDWKADGLPPRSSIPAMVEAQHRAATANGCAFWDTYAWMGGKGSSAAWFKQGLVVKDYQHPTSEGADKIAGALTSALTAD